MHKHAYSAMVTVPGVAARCGAFSTETLTPRAQDMQKFVHSCIQVPNRIVTCLGKSELMQLRCKAMPGGGAVPA